MTITTADFVGDIRIVAGANSDLTAAIARLKPDSIRLMLGRKLGNLVNAYADDSSVARYDYLLNGHTYTADDENKIYAGIKKGLLYDIYIKYQIDNNTFSMPVGNVKPSQENADNVSYGQKIQAASSKYWDELEDLWEFISDFSDTYPEFEVIDQDFFNTFDL